MLFIWTSKFLFIIFIQKIEMNGYTPYIGMYYPILMPPNIVMPNMRFFTTVSLYPQFVPLQLSNLSNGQNILQPATNFSSPLQKNEQKQQQKVANEEPHQINEVDKTAVQSEVARPKQQNKKNQIKKPKRPERYLTQKAFYMKQKLKGKQKTGIRILRKRLETRDIQKKNQISEKKAKIISNGIKTKKMKKSIFRDLNKNKKILNKIKLKFLNQCLQEFAQVPPLITGVKEINEFCRAKLESLMMRQLIKEQN